MRSAKLVLAALMIPASASLMALTGCGSEPSNNNQVMQLSNDVGACIKDLEIDNGGLKDELKSAYGYAVYPNVESGALVVKGASGNGQVFQGGNYIGFSELSVGGVGLSAGGQSYSEIVLFQNQQALSNFENNKLGFDATASATILQAGAATSAPQYDKNGVAVLKHVKGGLMVDASLNGQQFTFKPANAQAATQPMANP